LVPKALFDCDVASDEKRRHSDDPSSPPSVPNKNKVLYDSSATILPDIASFVHEDRRKCGTPCLRAGSSVKARVRVAPLVGA